jgi:energy-coupling factor transport system substrate-specific component
MVGVTGNLIFSVIFRAHWIYMITSVTLALLVGFFARKKSLDTFFGSMYVGILGSIATTAVSTPLNFFYFGGMTGNIWGDGVINLLLNLKWPSWLSMIIGEFYLDFFDKVITLGVVYLAIRIFRRAHKRKLDLSKKGLLSEEELLNNTALMITSAILFLTVIVLFET